MKKPILLFLACLSLTACGQQQGSSVDVGFGMTGYSTRFIKMDSHARKVSLDYLTSLYASHCGGAKAKHNLRSCKKERPFLTGGSIPVGAKTHPLPQEVMNEIGSIPPGTELVQSGYNVYLIRWPDKIIYDNVSLHPYGKESMRK